MSTKAQTNLQHYLCAWQQRVFSFHATAHRTPLGRYRTYIRLALCSSLITAAVCLVTVQFHKLTALSSTWRGEFHSIKFCPGCGSNWNLLLKKKHFSCVSQEWPLQVFVQLPFTPEWKVWAFHKTVTGSHRTCWTVTWKQACWMDVAFLHLKSEGVGKEL